MFNAATTVPLIIYAIYGPILFVIYCAQLVIVIVNKKKAQFRSSYFSLYIVQSFTGLSTFLLGTIINKLTLYPEVNSFYANFPTNKFATGLYFSSYYFTACGEYVYIFIALNRLSALTMYTKYEQIWSRFGWICLPVIFGFPFISYYHLVDTNIYINPVKNAMNDTIWAITYKSSMPWINNRTSSFYLYLICSTVTLTINLACVIALRCVSKIKGKLRNHGPCFSSVLLAPATEIRLFLLGITSFACGLPMTIQQFFFMFTKFTALPQQELDAIFYRLPWLGDLKALSPCLLSLIFSTAIRKEMTRCLIIRKPTPLPRVSSNAFSITRV